MAGILQDIGIVSNGKLTKNAYPGFIADVRRRLRTGQGIFRSPDLSNPTEPIPLYELAQIEKQFLFPEFHNIWRERYEKMTQQLNVPGGFGLIAGGVFLIDPVALAKALGVKDIPEVKFPDIFFEILGLPPPDGIPAPPPTIQDVITNPVSIKSLDFFNRYLKGVDPLNPTVMPKLMKIIMATPVPPTPAYPNQRLIRYGYAQRFNFENKVYGSHRATHASMMSQGITLIPTTISELSSGLGCHSLMKATKETAKLTQPIPMSTSVFEIAAQEILLQHQIKLESAVLLGQMLGSGAILTALATTPEEAGGLGLVNTSTTQQTQTEGGSQDTATNSSTSSTGTGASPGTSSSSSSISSQKPVSEYEDSSSFTSGQPVDDVPPPGGQSNQQGYGPGPGYGFGEPPPEGNTSDYQESQNQQTSGQPSGYGFGGPGEDVPPGQSGDESDLYPTQQGTGGSPSQSQNEPFGFESPPQDVPPPGEQGGGGGTGYNPTYASANDQPPADDYPPSGGSQGQQTYPPGFGDYPPDVGQQQQYSPAPTSPEENLGDMQGVNVPSAYESDEPQAEGIKDYSKDNFESVYVPPPGSTSFSAPEDEEGEENNNVQSSSKSFTKNLSNVRKRIRDLIQGGPTCPAENGFIGGILGPAPNFSEAETGFALGNKTLRGNIGGTSAKEWELAIPGANPLFIIGAGYIGSLKSAKKLEGNNLQSYTTNCTAMPGFIITNLLYNPDDNNTQNKIKVVFDGNPDAKTLANGYPYKKSQLQLPNELDVSGGGLVAPPYFAAYLDAWVCADPGVQNIEPSCTPSDPAKIRRPKYGDIYITRDNEKNVRHIGVIVGWSEEEGWIATADAGQGHMPQSQGMSYNKRPLKTGQNGNFLLSGEAAQGDDKSLRILLGWIDMDVLITKLKSLPGAYDSRPKPSWLY